MFQSQFRFFFFKLNRNCTVEQFICYLDFKNIALVIVGGVSCEIRCRKRACVHCFESGGCWLDRLSSESPYTHPLLSTLLLNHPCKRLNFPAISSQPQPSPRSFSNQFYAAILLRQYSELGTTLTWQKRPIVGKILIPRLF